MESAGNISNKMAASEKDKRVLMGSSAALRKSNFEVAQTNQGGSDF